MKILRRIIYFLSVIDIVQSNFHREVQSDQAIRGILQSIAHQDVIIRVQERDMDDRMKRLLEIVSEAVMGTWPTRILVSARLRSASQPPNAASSRTLLIYLCPSFKVIDYGELNVVLQEMSLMSHPKHLPKLLLVCATNPGARTLSALRQLKYLWHLRFFDAVVLEVSFPRTKQPEPVFVAAHIYDGFAERYTKLTSYDDDIVDWYPDKSRNMHGRRLRVTFKATAPYSTWDPVSGRLDGLAQAFSVMLSNIMNATVVQTSDSRDSDLVYDAQVLLHTDQYNTSYEHTVSVGHDRICLLLPVLSRMRIVMDLTEVIMSAVIGFVITTIAWSVSMSLSVGEGLRHPMTIISQILCIPPFGMARTTVERIMFVTIMLATAEYANVFHAELFRFSVRYTDHMRVSSFKDLCETGLKVLVPPMVHETIQTFGPVKQLPAACRDRFRPSTVELEVDRRTLASTDAYFVSETSAKLAELTRVDGAGKRLFKLYDLCVMFLYHVHTLPVRSPYREEIDRVLLIMTERGLAKKHLDESWEQLGVQETKGRGKIVIRDYSKYIGIIVVFMGCLLSIVVFAGELMVGLLSARKHSSRASVELVDRHGVDEEAETKK